MPHARAILWAHWRTLWNFYPRRGVLWTAVVGLGWYVIWLAAAVAFLRLFSNAAEIPQLRPTLPGGLLLMFLYWQLVPLLLASSGASLDLRKLRCYPVPEHQLFWIEIVLRITSAVEMVLVLTGIVLGVAVNPALPKWTVFGALFGVFNLVLAVGLRDLLARQLARKRIREVVVIVVVLSMILPQVMLARRGILGGPLQLLFLRNGWPGWPWNAAAGLLMGDTLWLSAAVLLAWIAAAYAFSSWQFHRSLRFDFDAARASSSGPARRWGRFYGSTPSAWIYRGVAFLLPDPVGAMVEKELRSLSRSSRFRLVYIVGLLFGSFMPLMFLRRGTEQGFFYENYLTIVCVYSLMLMSEICFWNVFGFDRSAAQIYFLAPVSFARVLVSKNVTAAFFLAGQIAMLTLVCVLLGLPLTARRLMEAYGATAVVMILLFSAGNLLSVYQAAGVNPAQSFRPGAAGRLQAMLFAVYPITFLPLALAYLARYAFASQAALYAMFAIDIAAGLAFYRLSLQTAAQTAERRKETMMAALSAGDGPIAD